MTDAIEQSPPLPPAVRRDPKGSERERPAPTQEEPPRTGPHPYKGTILDVIA